MLYEKKELKLLGFNSIDECDEQTKAALNHMFAKNFSVITKEQE